MPPPSNDPIIQRMRRERAYGSIYSSQYADAASSAKANEMARRLNMEPDLIEAAMPDMMAEDRLRKRLQQIETNHPYAKIMANPRLAKSAVDDDHLPKVAQRVEQHRQAGAVAGIGMAGGFRAQLVGRLLSGTAEMARGIVGTLTGLSENTSQGITLGLPLPALIANQAFRRLGRPVAKGLENVAEATRYRSTNRNVEDILSGVESVPVSMAALGATVFGSPLAGAALLGSTVGGDSYLTGRDEGLTPGQSAAYAGTDAAIELGTEFMPEKLLGRFVTGADKGVKAGAKALGVELLGETTATALQGLNRWYWIDQAKGVSFADFVSSLPDQERSTIVATLATLGVTAGAGVAARKFTEDRHSQEAAVRVDHIMQAAAESPTRTANPTDFSEALNQLVGDSAAANIYVPAEEIMKTLGDTPITDHPFFSQYAAQIEEAAALGGDVMLPVAEAATHLAGTPEWEALREHTRASPSGTSIAEAKQKKTPEQLQEMAAQANQVLSTTMGQVQMARARQLVGNWAQGTGTSGEQANVVNRMLASGLAANYGRDVQRRLAAGLQPQSMEDYAATYLPQVKRMAQADYEGGPGATFNAGVSDAKQAAQAATGDQASTLELRQPAGLRGGLGLLDVTPGSVLGTDEPIEGAPTRLTVPGRGEVNVTPHVPARQAAIRHMNNKGLNYSPARRYAKVDKGRATRIAAAFEAMTHDPADPVVAAAYSAMIQETLEQFQVIKETGLEIEFITGEDPYAASPRLAILDVQENNHLWVFPTEGGFGQGEITDSPLLDPVDEFIGGRQLLANDVFRIVHDYFGHIKDGHGFRAEGEENAWQSHAAMYSPLARRAMTTETRGQNSWLNFGPHAEHNKNASGSETIYAQQKIGLMPEWASEEGMLAGRESGTPRVRAYHGTPFEFDTFAPGKAAWFAEDRRLAERYSDPRRFRKAGEGRVIEAQLNIRNPLDLDPALAKLPPHTVVADPVAWARDEFGFDLPAHGWEKVGQDYAHAVFRSQAFADAARAAGYDAIKVTESGSTTWGMLNTGSATSPEGRALNQDANPNSAAFKLWFGDSKVVDENGNPLTVYHGSLKEFDTFKPSFDGGIYFSNSSESADEYALMGGSSKSDVSNVKSVYLSIQNPITIDAEGETFDQGWAERLAREIKRGKSEGFDGVILSNIDDLGYGDNGTIYVAFEPTQIKSVDNRGTFDPRDPIIFNQAVEVPGFENISPYLTHEERAKLRDQAKQKIMSLVETLPKAEEMAAVAVAGRAKKGWYADSAQAIVDVFGIADAPRFAALLAALSPQTSVEMNTFNALRAWTFWNNAGRPTDRRDIVDLLGRAVSGKKGAASVLNAWINNSVTALTAADPTDIKLSGPKVNSFMNNLVGEVNEVTNDTWMANYADVDPVLFQGRGKDIRDKGPGYKAFNVVVRKAAEIATEKTGMDWSPSEIQEAVWSFARTLYLRRDVAGEDRTMQMLLDAGHVTHADIADTPDFAVLFSDGIFRTILEEGGYDTASLQSSRRTAGVDGSEGSVAEAEGTGFDPDAFRAFLGQAAERLERVRNRRRADRGANDNQGALTFNQSVGPSNNDVARIAGAIEKYADSIGVDAAAQQRIGRYAPELELTDLFAREPGSGAGTKVMNELIRMADAAHLNLAVYPTSERNVQFYSRFGFEREEGGRGMLVRLQPYRENTYNQTVTPSEEAFYSAAQKVVSEAKQEKATAQQWKALLTPGKTPGIKSEEIEWTGVHDWLDMQQGPIDKGALLQFLRDRGIKVEEVQLGMATLDEAFVQREIERRKDSYFTPVELPTIEAEVRADIASGLFENYAEPGLNPQFKSWSSDPSNPTYRELLITIPVGEGGNPSRAPRTHWDTEAVVAHTRFMDKTDADGKRVLFVEEIQSDWHQKGRDQGYQQEADPEVLRKANEALKAAQAISNETFNEHYEAGKKAKELLLPVLQEAYKLQIEPILARLQKQGREQVAKEEDDGKKLEIAAEYLQRQQDVKDIYSRQMIGMMESPTQGSIIGYFPMEEMRQRAEQILSIHGKEIPAEVNEAMEAFNTADTKYRQAVDTTNLRAAEFNIAANGSGIPEAPFKSSWPALVMKRLIRYAAEHGYDRVAWTTGEEQAKRYSLATATGPIRIQTHAGGETHTVRVIDDAARILVENDMAKYQDDEKDFALEMTNDQLKAAFGNDIANKLIEGGVANRAEGFGREFILDGDDLRVGGEGMKAFYDRNLVNITNDIIKKYGAKVGPVTLVPEHEVKNVSNLRQSAAATDDAANAAGMQSLADEITAKWEEQPKNPGFEITDKMRDAAMGGFPLFQQKRGNISIIPGPDGLMQSALIRAFEASNFSTAVHELGHFFLEDLRRRALGSGALPQEVADWATFKGWAAEQGETVLDDSPIPVNAHEFFARGFERFTFEGQAPSRGLRAVFFKMREFMLDLYKRATQFNSPISPEIREVMGRMIASDEEVEQQRKDMALASGALDELMTEDERKAYHDLTEESRQDARDALFTKVLSTLKAEKTAETRQRKREIRDEVQADIDEQPIFRALKLLRVGTPIGDGQFSRVKLDRQQLIEVYGADIESRLPKTVPPIVGDTNTLDIDQVAALVGFDSGDEMVKALQTHADMQGQIKDSGDRRSVRQRIIDEQAEDRVRDEIGDPFENLEEEAQAAIANDRQADQLSMELRAISRKAGRKPTAWKLAKEWAEKRVRMQTSQDAVTGRAIQMYARNAAKAGQAAEEALVAGKFDEAFDAKQRQMLNLALMSEAKRAKDEVDVAVRRMKRTAGRDTIRSVDQDYLDQAHQLLEDVELKETSQTQVAKRMAFEDWYLKQVAEGKEPVVPAKYRSMLGKTHWSRMTINELLELDRAVGQIVELGRLKQRMRDGQMSRDFDEGISEMVGQAETTKERSKSKTTDPERTFGGRVKSRLRGVDAAMIKVEQMVEWLDGGEVNGPWRRLLFGVMSDAQTREKDLLADYVGRLNAMIQAMPRSQVKAFDRFVDTPELVIRNSGHSQAGQPFRGTKDQIVMMAMNWGNAGNRQRLLDGFGWEEADMLKVFDRLMTQEDWQFVQGVWDLVDSLWPEIERLERRVNGVAPERIEATAVQTKYGEFRGGYFPVVYDPNESTKAELDEASKLSPNGAWHQVTVRSGATRNRVERVMGRPLQLNMSVITRHLGEIIHDVSHREAVVQVRKILSDDRIRSVVNSRLGPEYYKRMGSWLDNVATPNVSNSKSDPSMVSIARHLNKGVSLVGLGFRFTTVAAQLLGFSNIKSEVKRSLLLESLRIITANPKTAYNEIVARSGEMRSRFDTMDASIDDMLAEAGKGKLRTIGPKGLVKYAFHGILYMDMLVTMTGWNAAFNQEMAKGSSEDDAVAFADSVIRKTQGAGAQKDRSAIMFDSQAFRSFYPFFSYLNALYNQQRDVFHRARRVEDVAGAYDVLRRGWWVMIAPAMLQALLFGQGPDDDEDDPEGWAAYLTKAVMLGNFASIPGVGPIAQAIGSGYGYRSNAWQGIGEDIKKGWDDVDKLLTDEDAELKGSTIAKIFSTVGILTAKPLGQIGATTRGVYDAATGEAEPESASDWYYLLTKGSIPKQPTAIQQLAEDVQGNDSSAAQ